MAEEEDLLVGVLLVRGLDDLVNVGLDVPPVIELATRNGVVDVRGGATAVTTIVETVDAVAGLGEALGQVLVVGGILHETVDQNDGALGVGDDVLAVEELGPKLVSSLEVAGLLLHLVGRRGGGRLRTTFRSSHGWGRNGDASHCHGAGNRQCAEFAWE